MKFSAKIRKFPYNPTSYQWENHGTKGMYFLRTKYFFLTCLRSFSFHSLSLSPSLSNYIHQMNATVSFYTLFSIRYIEHSLFIYFCYGFAANVLRSVVIRVSIVGEVRLSLPLNSVNKYALCESL